jgi:hypothetical protein
MVIRSAAMPYSRIRYSPRSRERRGNWDTEDKNPLFTPERKKNWTVSGNAVIIGILPEDSVIHEKPVLDAFHTHEVPGKQVTDHTLKEILL